MRYDTVIWDFNGTLADDVMLGIESVNTMLTARGLKPLSGREEYMNRFSFPVIEYYRGLGFDFDSEPYEKLAAEWFALYLAGEPELKPVEGAGDALEMISRAGLRQIVLSASESKLLNIQLNRFGFTQYFDRIIGGSDFLAGGKAETAAALLGKGNRSSALIGDTSHDFDVASAIGAHPYLFSGGHESSDRLSLTGAPVCKSLTDICRLILSENDRT